MGADASWGGYLAEASVVLVAGVSALYGIALRRLSENRRHFRMLADHSPDGVIIFEPGRKAYANRVFLQLTGLGKLPGSPEDLVDCFPKGESEAVRAVLASPGEALMETVFHTTHNGELALSLSCRRLVSGNKVTSVVVLRDITAFVQAEAEVERQKAELARQVSLQEAAMNATADALLVVGFDGRISEWNDRFRELWRIPAEVLEARDDARALAYVMGQLENPQAFLERVSVLYEERTLVSLDYFRFKDGRMIERHSCPQLLDGQPVGRVWSFRDVTDRERTRAELDRQVSLMTATLSATEDGIMALDNDGRIRVMNERMVRLWRIPESLATPPYDTRALLEHALDQVVSPEICVGRLSEAVSPDHKRNPDIVPLKDGRVFERTIRPQMEGGEVIGRVVCYRDVTAREHALVDAAKSAEQRARQVALLDATLEATTEPVLVYDSQGVVLVMNSHFQRMWEVPDADVGRVKSETVEHFQRRYVLPRVKDEARQAAETEAMAREPGRAFEHTFEMTDGRIFVRRSHPVSVAGGVIGRVCVYREITGEVNERARLNAFNQELERRVSERTLELERINRNLTESNAELESFSYSVSHDLRAPLRGIDGFSLALAQEYADSLDATGRDYLRRVRVGVQRMGRIMDDLIHLSRVNRVTIRYETVDLSVVAQEVMAGLRSQQPNRLVEFVCAESATGCCDKKLVRILLENLLGNAWKYSSKREHAVIEFGFVDLADGMREFFVRDNGVGFDPAFKDKLFIGFTRLHSPQEFEGSGLGLAIVARIIRRFGGKVDAESKPGAGATFRFSLRPDCDTGEYV